MSTALLEPARLDDEQDGTRTESLHVKRFQLGAQPRQPGNHPARLRLRVTDKSGNNQLGLLWGIRSRYYDAATTAQLSYEAEALTPLNGALVVTGVSGASGGSTVSITGVPAASWVPMLYTDLVSGSAPLTHRGSYRLWARCYSPTGTPEFQLLWGVGSLAAPVANAATTIPAVSGYYLLDLGEVRLDALPVGVNQWFGLIQVYSPNGGDSAMIDVVYLQPLDDGAGQLTYTASSPVSSISSESWTGAGADNSGTGTVAWSNPSNIVGVGGTGSPATTGSLASSAVSHYLTAETFGFAIPSIATIAGIEVTFTRYASASGRVSDHAVRLIKAGSVQTVDRSNVGVNWFVTTDPITYGSPSDLWGGTWAPSDINNSGFGAAISAAGNSSAGLVGANVYSVEISVYYTLGGFTVGSDAVVYANQTAEIRFDNMIRQGPTGNTYGPVSSVVGDLARLPPSGLENRPCQLFVKPTRGDLNSVPDSGLDGFTVQALYKPSFIFRP